MLTVGLSYFCIQQTFIHHFLLPNNHNQAEKNKFNWQAEIDKDAHTGGNSTIKINDIEKTLDFDVLVSSQIEYPFSALGLNFIDEFGQQKLIDLSQYSTVSFNVKCSNENVLTFIVFTYDEQLSDPDDFLTYRAPASFFSCHSNWQTIEIDLSRLELQLWWFYMFKVKLSHNNYYLDKVAKIQFSTTGQSPTDITSRVQISDLKLIARDWRYLYGLGVVLVIIWGGFIWLFFHKHTQALTFALKEKLMRERPLVAYQQLSIQPQKDKTKADLFQFLATEYANPDLNLETTAQAIGISRNRINDLLKLELGFTFSSYLNKLRLTEAARLLALSDEANVAEIAYSVGYKNVSYFNKLFKAEYACTPKHYQQVLQKTKNQ
ncbi:AraC family transcriptional regulator [Catenovulum sp. 2E275]|nr:AraC family transcriptional regulator [Catenovulum sp. 2E275]